jgi:hypothetical protein
VRRLAIVILVAALGTLQAASSGAAEHEANSPEVTRGARDATLKIYAEAPGSEPSEEEVARPLPSRPVYQYTALEWIPGTLNFCSRIRYTYNQTLADDYQFAWHRRQAEANGGSNIGRCPPQVRTVTTPPPVVYARTFWDERQLPTPTLTAAPGYAIAGKPIYLQIGGPTTQTLPVPNPIGAPITITTTSRYHIDWGDGTHTTTTSQGGPYPHGDVTHTYSTAATVTITVAQHWDATWTAGGAGGTLTGLQTDATLPLDIRQIQPVRTH